MGDLLNPAYSGGFNDASRAIRRGAVNEGLGHEGNSKTTVEQKFQERLGQCVRGDAYSCGAADALLQEWIRLAARDLAKAFQCRSIELRFQNREICREPFKMTLCDDPPRRWQQF